MNMSGLHYILMISIILFCESSSQQVEIHELLAAVNKIAIAGESGVPCKNDNKCLKSQQCLSNNCADPCPGSCGINALCHVQNHILSCECPQCYNGDPNKKCNKFQGITYWMCAWFGPSEIVNNNKE